MKRGVPGVRITKIMAHNRLFPGLLQRFGGSCRLLAMLSSLALLTGLTSCRQLQQLQVGQLALEQLNLEQLNSAASVGLDITVSASDQAGVFDLAGKTSLPDRTALVVLAVRYLNPAEPASIALNPEPTYSILAYQPVEVRQGRWQTQLNLWEVSANGQYQEAWQREQTKLGVSFDPTDNVVFLATLTPVNELRQLEQQLARRQQRLASQIIQSTSDGQRYAQVHQAIAVGLPTGNTAAPPPRPEDNNFGWGDRYIIPDEPPNPTNLQLPEQRQTNAPPRIEEFLR